MQTGMLRSIAWLTLAGADPLAAIEAAAAAGLDAVGLRLIAPLGLDLAHPIVGRPETIRAIRASLRATGLRVLDAEVITLAAATRPADFAALLDVAAELGATYVQLTSEDADRARAVANFVQVCDMAGERGLTIAFEFMQWRAVKTIEQAAAFIAASGRTNAGVVLDTLHLSRSGGSPGAVAALPRRMISFVQLCDAAAVAPSTDAGLIAEARGGRLYPGEGTLWLDALSDVLADDVAISIEVPPAPASVQDLVGQARRGAAALDAWLARRRRA